MKNFIDRIKGYVLGFISDAMAILFSTFTDDQPVLVPISVQSMNYYTSKRNPYAN